jgi:hypothetical protein
MRTEWQLTTLIALITINQGTTSRRRFPQATCCSRFHLGPPYRLDFSEQARQATPFLNGRVLEFCSFDGIPFFDPVSLSADAAP